MAPSRRESSGLGTTSSASKYMRVPRPVQSGQAPWGLLKENIRGVDLRVGDAAVDAGQCFGEDRLGSSPVDGSARPLRTMTRLGMVQGGLQRIGQTAFDALLDHEPVDDDVDVVLLFLVQLDLFGQLVHLPSMMHPDKPSLRSWSQLLAVLPLAAADHGRQQESAGSLPAGP